MDVPPPTLYIAVNLLFVAVVYPNMRTT